MKKKSAAAVIEAKFERYQEALRELIDSADELACVFEADTKEFRTAFDIVEGFQEHAAAIQYLDITLSKLAEKAEKAAAIA